MDGGYGMQQQRPQRQQTDNTRTLWMGDVQSYFDEATIRRMFSPEDQNITRVVIIPPRMGNIGYAFVEFVDTATSERVLNQFNGQPVPGSNPPRPFKLNRAQTRDRAARPQYGAQGGYGGYGQQQQGYGVPNDGQGDSIFVGNLERQVDEEALMKFFRDNGFQTVRSSHIVRDRETNLSRCYGFVEFADAEEAQRALNFRGGILFGREVKINRSNRRSAHAPQRFGAGAHLQGGMGMGGGFGAPNPMMMQQQQQMQVKLPCDNGIPRKLVKIDPHDPENTTVFIGGLGMESNAHTIFSLFYPFGRIVNVKMVPNKACAFVQFTTHQEAETAIQSFNGRQIGTGRVRCDWGQCTTVPDTTHPAYAMMYQQAAAMGQVNPAAAAALQGVPAPAAGAMAAAASPANVAAAAAGFVGAAPAMPPGGAAMQPDTLPQGVYTNPPGADMAATAYSAGHLPDYGQQMLMGRMGGVHNM